MGCAITYQLAAGGITGVLLLERDVLGSGATGRSTASVHSHYSTKVLARMAWHSLQVFRNFDEAVGGRCGFAETGHLVLGTLHTNGAAECVERMVGIFPANQQEQVQYQLSIGLTGVVFQTLLPRIEGRGRIAAFEVMVGTSAIKNLIRQNQLAQIRTFMFMGGSYGMQTLEQSLVALTQQGLISKDDAYSRANDRSTFEKLMAPTGQVEEKEE